MNLECDIVLSLVNDISKEFGVDILLPLKVQEAIDTWRKVYIGEPDWATDGVRQLNIGIAVAMELARLTTVELRATFGDAENEIMQRFLKSIRCIAEYSCALGSSLFVPYTAENGDILISVFPANQIFPVAFDEFGRLTSVITARYGELTNRCYTLLEFRQFQSNTEVIEYKAYASTTPGVLGAEIPVSETKLWPALQSGTYTISGIDAPLFAYWRMPFAFPYDPSSQIGVSCYNSAVSHLKDADLQYSRYLWEYQAGEFALNVDASALDLNSKPHTNFSVAQLDKRIYRGVEIKDLFQEWAPNLRDGSYYAGLNNILRRIEFECGLSYGTLSDVNIQEKTATEIMASKQRSYATISGIQNSLEQALRQLDAAICSILNKPQDEPVFSWDDSIIVDTIQEKNIFMQEISAGIRAPWEYRVVFLGETEEQAKEAIAEIEKSNVSDFEFGEEEENNERVRDEEEEKAGDKEEQEDNEDNENNEEDEGNRKNKNKKLDN